MWSWWTVHSNRQGRRRGLLEQFGWQHVEALELRCLLSASGHQHGHSQAQVETVSASEPDKKTHASKFMDVSGTWNYVIHTDSGDFTGILVLQQHGKKVTGTLTHDMQPPGEVKLKLVKSKGKSDDQDFRGKMQDLDEESEDEDTEGEFSDDDDDGRADRAFGMYHGEHDDDDWDAEHQN